MAYKMTICFRALWEQCAKDGKLDSKLGLQIFALIRRFFIFMADNTQSTEGLNSVIKHIKHLCPHISFALLSARVVNHSSIKWFPTRRDDSVALCIANHDAALSALQDVDRQAGMRGQLQNEAEQIDRARVGFLGDARGAGVDVAVATREQPDHNKSDNNSARLEAIPLQDLQDVVAAASSSSQMPQKQTRLRHKQTKPQQPQPQQPQTNTNAMPADDDDGGDDKPLEEWLVKNKCAIRKCGYTLYRTAYIYESVSFCYDVVAKKGRTIVQNQCFLFCFKYGYMPWLVKVEVVAPQDADDCAAGIQHLNLIFPFQFEPLSEWAVRWHDLAMYEENGEVLVYRRDVSWCLPSLASAVASERPRTAVFCFSNLCRCGGRRAARRAGDGDDGVGDDAAWARDVARATSMRRIANEPGDPEDLVSLLVQEQHDQEMRKEAKDVVKGATSAELRFIARDLTNLASATGALAESEAHCMEEVAMERQLLEAVAPQLLKQRDRDAYNNSHSAGIVDHALSPPPVDFVRALVDPGAANECLHNLWASNVVRLADAFVYKHDREALSIAPWVISLAYTPLESLDALLASDGEDGDSSVIESYWPTWIHWDNVEEGLGASCTSTRNTVPYIIATQATSAALTTCASTWGTRVGACCARPNSSGT